MTWLFIPSNSAPVSACLERDCEPGSSSWASRIAPSATWSGKLTQPRFWSRAWKKAPWTQRLSGPTCSPSTLDAGVDAWISSLRDSRAKTSVSPDGGLASMVPAPASSSTSSTTPTLAVRQDSFWRTLQESLLPQLPLWTRPAPPTMPPSPLETVFRTWALKMVCYSSARLPESWGNWPTAGGMRNGSLFQRPTWAPAMDASGGSALHGGTWHTPDTMPEAPNRNSNTKSKPAGIGNQAVTWMTPSVSNSQGNEYTRDRGQEGAERLTLTGQANQWPTPNAHVIEHKRIPPIVDGTRQPTDPQISTADYAVHVFYSHPGQQTLNGPEFSASTPTLPRRLNPIFAEWLMGWPLQWTKAEPHASSALATESWRSALQQHLSCLLDEQASPVERLAA